MSEGPSKAPSLTKPTAMPLLPPRKKRKVEGPEGPEGPAGPCAMRGTPPEQQRPVLRHRWHLVGRRRSPPAPLPMEARPQTRAVCAAQGAPGERGHEEDGREPGAPGWEVQLAGIDPVLQQALHALGSSMEEVLRSVQGGSAEFEAGVRHALRGVARGMARHAGLLP